MTQRTYMPRSTEDTSYSTPVLSNVLPGVIPNAIFPQRSPVPGCWSMP